MKRREQEKCLFFSARNALFQKPKGNDLGPTPINSILLLTIRSMPGKNVRLALFGNAHCRFPNPGYGASNLEFNIHIIPLNFFPQNITFLKRIISNIFLVQF